MYIEQIRHATLLIIYREYKILVDPMFSRRGTMFSLQTGKLLRMKRTNPMVDLPRGMEERLEGVTHVLLTHNHFDHIDGPAIDYLREMNIEVFCAEWDVPTLRKKGLRTHPLKVGIDCSFLGGSIRLIPNRHGWGWMGGLMGQGVGYVITMPDEPSLYIIGDAVLTEEVRKALTEYKPEWIILAAGKARLGAGRPLLMDEDEILEVVELSHGRVVMNHMEAMDHCLLDRRMVMELMRKNKLENRVVIPDDGDIIECI